MTAPRSPISYTRMTGSERYIVSAVVDVPDKFFELDPARQESLYTMLVEGARVVKENDSLNPGIKEAPLESAANDRHSNRLAVNYWRVPRVREPDAKEVKAINAIRKKSQEISASQQIFFSEDEIGVLFKDQAVRAITRSLKEDSLSEGERQLFATAKSFIASKGINVIVLRAMLYGFKTRYGKLPLSTEAANKLMGILYYFATSGRGKLTSEQLAELCNPNADSDAIYRALPLLNNKLQDPKQITLVQTQARYLLHFPSVTTVEELFDLAVKPATTVQDTAMSVNSNEKNDESSQCANLQVADIKEEKTKTETPLKSRHAAEVCQQHDVAMLHAIAAAVREQYIVKKAIENAVDEKDNRFDIQGHLLIDVTLTAKDYDEIVAITLLESWEKGYLPADEAFDNSMAQMVRKATETGTTPAAEDIAKSVAQILQKAGEKGYLPGGMQLAQSDPKKNLMMLMGYAMPSAVAARMASNVSESAASRQISSSSALSQSALSSSSPSDVKITLQLSSETEALLGTASEEKNEAKEAKPEIGLTDKVVCSIDVIGIPENLGLKELQNRYVQWLQRSLKKENKQSDLDSERRLLLAEQKPQVHPAITALLQSPARHSIIPLQSEIYDHMKLMGRVLLEPLLQSNTAAYVALFNKGFVTQESVLQDAFHSMDPFIQEEVQKALLESVDGTDIDIAKFNGKLDAARESLAELSRKVLLQAIYKKLDPDEREPLCSQIEQFPWDDELFKSTTATGLDFVGTDNNAQTCISISATDETAHNKRSGCNAQAQRVFTYGCLRYNEKFGLPEVIPPVNPSVQARVPSLAVLKLMAEDKENEVTPEKIQDVIGKIEYGVDRLQRIVGENTPVIYNLLTSFAGDGRPRPDFDNQNVSADIILQGAHRFNKERIASDKGLFYVQAIPTNEHTTELDRHSGTPVIAEAALMAEFSLLTTLVQNICNLPTALHADILALHKEAYFLYSEFLINENQPEHFHASPQGRKLNSKLDEFHAKYSVQDITQIGDESSEVLVTQALFKILASDQYKKEKYGRLVQAFSMFLERASEMGCKSANERFATVAGRCAALMSLANKLRFDQPISGASTELNFLQNLRGYVSGDNDLAALNSGLDGLYNHTNVNGLITAISREDSGPSKIDSRWYPTWEGSPKKFVAFVFCWITVLLGIGWWLIARANTNKAESSDVTNAAAANATALESHRAHMSKWLKENAKECLQEVIMAEEHGRAAPRPSLVPSQDVVSRAFSVAPAVVASTSIDASISGVANVLSSDAAASYNNKDSCNSRRNPPI